MVELVDTLDLKSNGHYGRAGSSPAFSTKKIRNMLVNQEVTDFLFLYLYGFCMVEGKIP